MNISVEKLEYIDKFLDDYINNLIVNVLNLKTDHEKYSALIINNIILCYIDFENQMGYKRNFSSVKGFFEIQCFTPKEYGLFLEKYKRESQHYSKENI